VLRETRSSLQSEVEQLRRRLDDRESELQRTYREMNALTLTKDNEISSLRAELKMKTFEAHSLGATFEVSSLSLPPGSPPSLSQERMGQLKAATLELEVLREEVSVHRWVPCLSPFFWPWMSLTVSRTAILRLESESETKELRLRESLARAYETIRAYELLLHESGDGDSGGIGTVSLTAGNRHPPAMSPSQSAWSDSAQPHPPLPITVLASDPRKLRQLLDTTEKSLQKIAALESKVREQQRALEEHERQQTETALKMDRAKRCLSLMNQPSKYLLERLNEKEVECLGLERRVKEKELEVEEAGREKRGLEVETTQLRERLQLLLAQRNEISSLRTMLEALRREEQEGEEEELELNEEGDGGSVLSAEEGEEREEAVGVNHSVGSLALVVSHPTKSPTKQGAGPSFQTPQRDRSPPPPPSSPPPSLVMEATRPVTALDLGLSPAAMRSMLERTQPTPSKKRITTG
jgi:hypothetical protein